MFVDKYQPLRDRDVEVLGNGTEELKTGNLETVQLHQFTQFHHKPGVGLINSLSSRSLLTLFSPDISRAGVNHVVISIFTENCGWIL